MTEFENAVPVQRERYPFVSDVVRAADAKPSELVAVHVGTPPETMSTCPVVPIALLARVFAPDA
jgi:hypothetical protein